MKKEEIIKMVEILLDAKDNFSYKSKITDDKINYIMIERK